MSEKIQNENTVLDVNSSIAPDEFTWVGQNTNAMQQIARESISYWKDALNRLKSDKAAMVFIGVLVVITLLSIVVPLISPYTIAEQHLEHKSAGMFFSGTFMDPKTKEVHECFHLLGTDGLGRDLLVRAWAGGRTSLLIAFTAVFVNGLVGVIYGGVSGYFGGMVDNIMMRIVEIINGIPYLLIVIVLMTILKPGVITIVIAYATVGWCGMARLVRGQVIQLKEQEFVIAASTLGASSKRIIGKHLIPNILSIIIINLTLAIPSAIFTEAFLSFLGLGVQIPDCSWGSLTNEAMQNFRYYPLELAVPATLICVTMLSFNLLGDKLRDAFDPKLRR